MSEHYNRILSAAGRSASRGKESAASLEEREDTALEPSLRSSLLSSAAGRASAPESTRTPQDDEAARQARARLQSAGDLQEKQLTPELEDRELEPVQLYVPLPVENRNAFDDGPFVAVPTPDISPPQRNASLEDRTSSERVTIPPPLEAPWLQQRLSELQHNRLVSLFNYKKR